MVTSGRRLKHRAPPRPFVRVRIAVSLEAVAMWIQVLAGSFAPTTINRPWYGGQTAHGTSLYPTAKVGTRGQGSGVGRAISGKKGSNNRIAGGAQRL